MIDWRIVEESRFQGLRSLSREPPHALPRTLRRVERFPATPALWRPVLLAARLSPSGVKGPIHCPKSRRQVSERHQSEPGPRICIEALSADPIQDHQATKSAPADAFLASLNENAQVCRLERIAALPRGRRQRSSLFHHDSSAD